MTGKGTDALLKSTRVTEWTVNNSGYLTFLFGGFLVAGCLFAYVIAVARGNVDAFLPLISDAAGSPPQNGIFGTLVSLGCMIGVVFMIVRYMIVMEQNQEKSKLVTNLNKMSLIVGILSMFGITLVTGYPMNFYRNRDVWLNDVGLPHMIGGVMFFAFGLAYIALQCALTFLLSSKDKTMLFSRLAICMICAACFVYHMVTVPDNFGGISEYYFDNLTEEASGTKQIPYPATLGASLRLPIDTSGSYVSSAISEWILVFSFCAFFLTFFKETQEYSLLVVIETQMPEAESMNDVSVDQNGKSIATGRRESEVKTLFRRDSTCQTVLDSVESDDTKTTSATTFVNGKYIQRQVSSFQMLTGGKLDNLIESQAKSKSDTVITDSNVATENGDTSPLPESQDVGVGSDSNDSSEDQFKPASENVEETDKTPSTPGIEGQALESSENDSAETREDIPNGVNKDTETESPK